MKSMKFSVSRLVVVLLAAALTQGTAFAKGNKAAGAAGDATSVATVNGVPVSKGRVDSIVAQQVEKGAQDTPEMREQIKNFLIGRELLAQASKAKGLEKQPEVTAEIELAKQQILIGAYLQQYMKMNPVSDAKVKAEYDRLVGANQQKEFKVRHILVEGEAEAKDIIEKLNKGEKFDTLAAQSKDPGSKDKGGDLGWNVPGNFVEPFARAMVNLNKGSYTTVPVKSQFGYHVIKVEDQRDAVPPTLDQVKPQIQQSLTARAVEEHVAELRKKAKVQ